MYVFEIKSNSEYSLHTCIFIIIRSSVIKKIYTIKTNVSYVQCTVITSRYIHCSNYDSPDVISSTFCSVFTTSFVVGIVMVLAVFFTTDRLLCYVSF